MNAKSTSITALWALTTSAVSIMLPRAAAAFDPPTAPCSLFTTEQVSSTLELKAMPGKPVVSTLCEWNLSGQGSSNAASKKLTVGFLSATAWEQTKALAERMKGIARTPIAALGDEAVFATSQITNTLQVKKGNVVLDMHLYGFAPEEAKAKEIALARLALGKF